VSAEEWSQLVGWPKFGAEGNGGPGVVVDHAFEIVSEGLKDVLVMETRFVGHIKQEWWRFWYWNWCRRKSRHFLEEPIGSAERVVGALNGVGNESTVVSGEVRTLGFSCHYHAPVIFV
jgi:hypothetical protein